MSDVLDGVVKVFTDNGYATLREEFADHTILDGDGFTFSMDIAGVAPSSGGRADLVTVFGTGLGPTQETSTITVDGETATVVSWSETDIIIDIPGLVSSGSVTISVTVNGVTDTVGFTVLDLFFTVLPDSGYRNGLIAVSGVGFGPAQGSSTMAVGGQSATVVSWSYTAIVATVPLLASTGVGSVAVTVGGVTVTCPFSVLDSALTDIDLTLGHAGDKVTVLGEGLGTTQGSSTIMINDITPTVVSWSDIAITVIIPNLPAGPASIVLTVNGVTGSFYFDIITSPAVLLYGDLDLNDGVTYKLMREGFKYPLPENQQKFSDSPLTPGQKPSDNWKPDNRQLSFSIFVDAADALTLNVALNALYSAAYAAESTVTWRPKGGFDLVYFKAYRAPAIDPSSYFRTEYRSKNQAIVLWSCQGAPYPHLDRVTLPLTKELGLNDSFVKRATNDFENWTETVSGGTITANTTDYLEGGVSCKMTTTNAAHTCSIIGDDYLVVNPLHAHNAKLFAYKNSGTLTLDFDLLCYDAAGTLLGTLSLLTAYNPADTTWMDVIKVAGSPVVYPSDSSLSPRFPAGTAKVKRQIRHDTTIGVVSLDSLYFGDTEYVVGHELEGAMAICVPPGECLGNVPARARLHVGSAFSSGPWSLQGSGTAYNLNGISALDATHAWAVGDHGVLSFYNGLTWTVQAGGTANSLKAVSACNSTHVWAVGDNGTIVYWDGSTWATQTYSAFAEIADTGLESWPDSRHLTNWNISGNATITKNVEYSHSGSACLQCTARTTWYTGDVGTKAFYIAHPGDIFAASYWNYYQGSPGRWNDRPYLICYDSSYTKLTTYYGDIEWPSGASWTNFTYTFPAVPDGTRYIRFGMLMEYQGDENGVIWFCLDDIALTRVNNPDLYGVKAISTTNIITVGQDGRIIKSADGSTWTEETSGTAYNLNSVSACDASHIWTVGGLGTILFSADGTTWTAQTSGTTVKLQAVYALDSTHVWAVGESGLILFFNGTNWAQQTSGTWDILYGVYAYNATNVWAVGSNGIVLFFNGTAWTVQGYDITTSFLMAVSGISATSVWVAGLLGTIGHGVVAVGAMPMTNLIVGQRDTYAENWNPVQDATGATAEPLYSRHGQYYRAMAPGATNKFRFPVGTHRGRYLISLGVTWDGSTTYDQVTIDCYLEAADGTRLTVTTVALPSLDMGNPNGYFKEVAFATSGTRLIDVSLPTHFVPQGTNEDNIYQVFEVKVNGSLAFNQEVDCMTLIPVDKCVELSGLANNFVILDSEGRANLVSQDGSLDTATMYDPTKMLDTPRFEADPAGMNLVVLAGNIVSGDESLTPKLDIVMTFEPNVWMTP